MNNFHKKFSTSILKKKDFYHIKINNNFLKTPHGNTFFVPSKNIAKVVLSELNLGTENSAVVSFTKITNSAIDIINNDKKKFVKNLAINIHNDAICYFSNEPKDLFFKQKQIWTPLLLWIKKEYSLGLKYTKSFKTISQSLNSVQILNKILMNYNIFQISCINTLCQITGSIIISLALEKSKITHKEAFNACLLEELYQLSKWGDDSEANCRREAISNDIYNASVYLREIKLNKVVES